MKWQAGPEPTLESAGLWKRYEALLETGKPALTRTLGTETKPGQVQVLTATYRAPYLAHTAMEPMNCTAKVGLQGVEVWIPNQSPTLMRLAAAKAAGVAHLITFKQADVTKLENPLPMPAVEGESRQVGMLISNPPYVDAGGMAALPAECRAEPALAFDGGADGLDVVRRILTEAKAHLAPQGGLLCEVGRGRDNLEAAFPQLPLLWLDTEDSEGEVFWIAASDL
mgnify:CR=1 FL=1